MKIMSEETVESLNYDLDLLIAEGKNITLDQLDALPLAVVSFWRRAEINRRMNGRKL